MDRIKSLKFELERAAAAAYRDGKTELAMRLLAKAGRLK
jgi:hypothetical protein